MNTSFEADTENNILFIFLDFFLLLLLSVKILPRTGTQYLAAYPRAKKSSAAVMGVT